MDIPRCFSLAVIQKENPSAGGANGFVIEAQYFSIFQCLGRGSGSARGDKGRGDLALFDLGFFEPAQGIGQSVLVEKRKGQRGLSSLVLKVKVEGDYFKKVIEPSLSE